MENYHQYTFYRGRVGLFAILKVLGVKKGDKVLTQAFTCLAVPEAIMSIGATPIYVDTEKNSVNMDLEDLKKKINEDYKALIVQHTYGIPARIEKLAELASQYGIPVIEDCCHTFNSSIGGKEVGNFGVSSFYSFEWGKPIVAGLGGSVIINDDEIRTKFEQEYQLFSPPPRLATLKINIQYFVFKLMFRPIYYWYLKKTFRKLSTMGIAEGNYNAVSEELNEDFTYLMTSSAYRRMVSKLRRLEDLNKKQLEITEYYDSHLDFEKGSIEKPLIQENSIIFYARYPLITENKYQLLEKAEMQNIEISDWYTTVIHPLNESELDQVHYHLGSCPNAESLSKRIISLPVGQSVDDRYMKKVVNFLNTFKE